MSYIWRACRANVDILVRIFIPVEDSNGYGDQHIWVVDKDEKGVITKKKLYGVRYVPLTDAPKGG